jgi:hypothetical protein
MAHVYIALDKRLHSYLLAREPPEHDELRELCKRTQAIPEASMPVPGMVISRSKPW